VGVVIVADAGALDDFCEVAWAPSRLVRPKVSNPAIVTIRKSFDIFSPFTSLGSF